MSNKSDKKANTDKGKKQEPDNLPYGFRSLKVTEITTNGGKLRQELQLERFPDAVRKKGILHSMFKVLWRDLT